MPWKNYEAAKKAAPGLVSITPPGGSGPQPVKNKAALDALASIYDAVKAGGQVKNPAAVAKATFVKAWTHKGKGVWERKAPLKKEAAVTELQVPFASFATLVKAYTDESGKRYVVYACADDGPDLQKAEVGGTRTIADVIDLAFLEKMARENVAKALPLVATHEDPFQAECPLGKAVESWIEPAGASPFGKRLAHNTLLTKFELTDGDPRADVLYQNGLAGGDGRGTSVHGGISRVAVELAKNAAGFVRRILDGYLDHHAVVVPGRAANPRMGMVAAMSKALDESGAEIAEPGLEKAEVSVYVPTEHGEVRATGYVDSEDDDYKSAASPDFGTSLVAIRTRRAIPRLNDLLKAVIDRIMWADEEDVPDKKAAMIAAVNAHDAEVKRLVSAGDLSKSQADELTDAAAALVEGAETMESDAQTAAGEPVADGGTAAKEDIPMAEQTLEKALDPKAVGAVFAKFARAVNPLLKLMGGTDEDALPEDDSEATVEKVEKSLQDVEAGLERFELLSKGFMAQMSLDPASKTKADAAVRETEAGKTPIKGALGMAPGAMSKEQIDEFAEALKAQGYVLAKAEELVTVPIAPAQPEPVTDEIERVVGLLANHDLVKAVVAKLPGATREALNKSLAPQAAQPTGEPLGSVEELGQSGRSDADYYADFMRRHAATQ